MESELGGEISDLRFRQGRELCGKPRLGIRHIFIEARSLAAAQRTAAFGKQAANAGAGRKETGGGSESAPRVNYEKA